MSPRRTDIEPLARERIVAAAMKVIDDEGLDALSMRRLGVELGVNPMAAYYHIPNKAALYDLVLEAVMAEADTSGVDPSAPLEDQIKQAARAFRAAALKHPRAIPVFGMRSFRTETMLRPVEPLLGALFAAGLTATEAVAAIDCLAQYILGGLMGYYHQEVAPASEQPRPFDTFDKDRYPNLNRMIAEGDYLGFEGEFEFGLDAIVHGLLEAPGRRADEAAREPKGRASEERGEEEQS